MDETIEIDGLCEAAQIRVDRWGIAHLRAAGEADLFFLQGFNAARDRLWQMDLWRKRGLGLLAADFGPGYLAQDFAARHFLYRGEMAPEWASYAPDAEAICTSFAAGINAYVDLCGREPERLPPEFALFATAPARWLPQDVVRVRSHALSRNAVSEILRANVLTQGGGEGARIDLLRAALEPAVQPAAAGGLDLGRVKLAALDLFKLAAAPVSFEPARLEASLEGAWDWISVTDLGDVVRAAAEEGSNNWAVHGSRTMSGRPILASDPHRAHAVPSLRYLVHLSAPGFDAIGAGEPTAPGISLGHNGQLAFGLTISGADQEDVYVYDLSEEGRYRHGEAWLDFERQTQSFAVRGMAPQELTLTFSRHGPVVHLDQACGTAIAIRSVWAEPGSAAYLGSLSAMRTTDVAAFGASLSAWGTPSVNHVCADTGGDIGWFTAGFTPIRPNWDGLLPVPGDGRFEWSGFISAAEMPQAVSPAAGFVATANEMNLPADRPADAPPIGFEWAEPSRAHRIFEVLTRDGQHTVEASCALQTDVLSLPATRLCCLLDGLDADDPSFDFGRALLRGWDHALSPDSGAAALFELWWMLHLKPALTERLVPDPKLRALLVPGDLQTILQRLECPTLGLGEGAVGSRDRMLVQTLVAAVADARLRLGGDPARWAWGSLHHAEFEHAAHALLPGDATAWNVGPFPLGGSRSTPMNAAYRLGDFRVVSGASVRLVIDVGDWDESVCINSPGQSGDPASPHYGDLAVAWAQGGYVPLVYSSSRVEAETRRIIRLLPIPSAATSPSASPRGDTSKAPRS